MKFFFYARKFLSQEIPGFPAMLVAAATFAIVAGCGSGSTASTPASPSAGGNRIQLTVSNAQIPSAGATTITVTATLLSSTGQTISGQALAITAAPTETVSFSAVSGAVTDTNGKVTATLSNLVDKTNRTVTVTATAGTTTATIPVLITGSTATASTTSSTLADDGSSPATLTITAKDSAGAAVANVPVTFTTSGAGGVTVTAAAATTDVNGKVTATVKGAAVGTATVTATTLGATVATSYTVTATAATFSIDQTTNSTGPVVTANPITVSMTLADSLVIRASAPTSATVTFATTLGSLNAPAAAAIKIVNVPVVAGKASVTLLTNQAGVATVQAFDPAATTNSASITVAITSVIANANAVTLQASPSVVPKSVGTTTGVSTLSAKVTDGSGQPVGGAPVAFSIVTGTGTGGGETVTPVVAFTASSTAGGVALGEARATFTSGSISSGQTGVKIRATVIGAPITVETATAPSGPDAAVVIGGTAGSVAFGTATTLSESTNGANYIQSMSVLVADSNGNPVANNLVNLSAWPIAWSTGTGCVPDANTATTGTFFNEDANENLTLDAGEDGTRRYYTTGALVGGGRTDGLATPPSSAAGLVPGTVTTDANGVATFDLTYGKSNALWTVTRLRARTTVFGTEAVSEIQFRLPATETDVKLPTTCRIPNSPYFF